MLSGEYQWYEALESWGCMDETAKLTGDLPMYDHTCAPLNQGYAVVLRVVRASTINDFESGRAQSMILSQGEHNQ